MNDRKLLIVGIDPGITTAYAVLDIDLNLIGVRSSKQLDLNQLISNISGLGKVILVGTDKAKIPHLVEDFSAKFGANIANPKEDLGVEEKKSIAANFIVENEHQADALASALFAYKSIKSLLDKIDHFVEENKKQNIRNKIKELVILNKISIKSAVSLIENKDKEEQIIEKVVVEKKLNQSDFLSLYDKLKKYESEIKLMGKYNNDLKNRISNLLAERAKEPKPINKKPINFSEKTIRSLQNKIRIMEKEAFQYRASIKKFNELISNIKNFHTLKKLNNLGFKEFSFKNKILNIQPNDILLFVFFSETVYLVKQGFY